MNSPITVLSPDFIENPYPTYLKLQDESPVYWHKPTGYFWLTRYEDVWQALHDPRFRSGRFDALLGNVPAQHQDAVKILRELLEPRLLLTDGEQHTRLRSLITHAFSPRQIEQIRPVVQDTIGTLLDGIRGKNQIEVIGELADPLPSRIISRIIGLPQERFEEFKAWTNNIYAFIGISAGNRGEQAVAAGHAARAVRKFLETEIEDRKQCPRADLLTVLTQAEEDGEKLTHSEIIANIVGLLNAGHETTANLLGNGLYTLLQHPEVMTSLRVAPSRMASALEEIIRIESPVQILGRQLGEAVDLHGIRLSAGANVLLMVGAANRDPRAFEQPEHFALDRAGSRHLAFGFGSHFCIGAALARVIAEEFFRRVLSEWKSLSLAGPVQWRPFPIFRGLSRLSIDVTWALKPDMDLLQ